jgi:hypothetical protein
MSYGLGLAHAEHVSLARGGRSGSRWQAFLFGGIAGTPLAEAADAAHLAALTDPWIFARGSSGA